MVLSFQYDMQKLELHKYERLPRPVEDKTANYMGCAVLGRGAEPPRF